MIEANIGTILLVTGILTFGVGLGLFLPRQLLEILLGEKPSDATMVLVARHWSLLGALVGALLAYAAYHPEIRAPVMVVAIAEKLALGVLVIASPLRTRVLTMFVVCADAVMALLYVLFLLQHHAS